MTREEIIDFCEMKSQLEPENEDIFNYIIKAMEKQIPKQPVYEGDGYDLEGNIIFDEWLCPCCGTRYEVDYDEYDFCPNCGQAIDWSEKE